MDGRGGVYPFISSLRRFGGGRGLDAIRKSLASVGDPQESFPSIHVAGTNGKGSVSSILDSLLREAGYKVGLFTSPHLRKMTERIRVCGSEIDDEAFADTVHELEPIIRRDELTFFEALTLVAFQVFHDRRIDIGVIEAGLGGRLDATNLVNPILTIITNIDRDHTAYLGENVESIAMEKLGIAKPGVPLLTGIEKEGLKGLFERVCGERQVPLHLLDDEVGYSVEEMVPEGTTFDYRSSGRSVKGLRVPLIGRYQARNAALAVRSLEIPDPLPVQLDEETLKSGLGNVRLPGRFQIVRAGPSSIVLDVFHNQHGAEAVLPTISEMFPHRRLFLIIGMAGDKDLEGTVEVFRSRVAGVITVKPRFRQTDRDVGAADLEPIFRRAGVDVFPARSMRQAFSVAESLRRDGDVLLVGGSFRTVAAALSILNDS